MELCHVVLTFIMPDVTGLIVNNSSMHLVFFYFI